MWPILLAIGFLLKAISDNTWISLIQGDDKFVLLYTFFGRSFEFLAGMFLALNFEKIGIIRKKFAAGLGLFLMFGLCFYLSQIKGHGNYGLFTYQGIFINNILLPIPIAILIGGLLYKSDFLHPTFSSKIMVILGKSSYAFYLIHLGFINTVLYKILGLSYWVTFVGLWGISYLIFTYIEEPLNLKIRRLL